jgi:hypothetical protein
MRYAILNGNKVENVIVADAEFAASVGAVQCPDYAGIDWTYDGANWTAPSPFSTLAPQVVTMRQARLALLAEGKLNDVETAIESLPSPQKEAAKIEWEYSTEVRLDSELVKQLAPGLGLDDAALETLFTQAATL